jgi:hypothetical protein
MVRELASELQCGSDAEWVIAYALIQSLAADLAKLRKFGLWSVTPSEMRQSPWFNVPCSLIRKGGRGIAGESEWHDTPNFLLRQYEGALTLKLCAIISSSSNGAIQINQSDVLRLAKHST